MNNFKKICTGIVLYNPDIDRLKENLNSISKQCNKIFLQDNNSDNIKEIKELIKNYNNIELHISNINEGIAEALNKIIINAENQKFMWVLTLDQDSVCNEKLVENYLKFLNAHNELNIGCLTCNIIDRNFDNVENIRNYQSIDYCITSGSLVKISAIKDCGGFDSKMFIDKVDTDICIALKKMGYEIIRIEYTGLLHEIGHAKQINLGFRKWELYNHNPLRRYYMCRNSSYLLKKYHNKYVLNCFLKEIFQTILVLIFENQKFKKFVLSLKGFLIGFFI